MSECWITLDPEQVAKVRVIKDRYRNCFGCGKPAKAVLVEVFAAVGCVGTICDDCGTGMQEVTS